jgi:hypothetical protein
MFRQKLPLFLTVVLVALTISVIAVRASQLETGSPIPDNFDFGRSMNATHYQLDWNMATYGGGNINSNHFQVSSTIGQPVIGISASSNFEVCSGFWCKVLVFFEVYLPIQSNY